MHSLALVSAVDPVLVDLTALSLHGEEALVLTASLHADGEPTAGPDADPDPDGPDGFVRLTAVDVPLDDGDGPEEPAVLDVPRPTDCWTCSLREVITAVVEERAEDDPDGATVVLLPAGIELIHLVPHLAADLDAVPGVELAGVAHLVDVDTAAHDLLEHRPAPAPVDGGEERCAGELHMVALGYADAVVALGSDPVGRDLVEHLRPHDALLLPGLDAPLLPELLALRHDAEAAVARVHPATTQAWGGPSEHGVRTLDLSSDMPFHPGRLRELVEDLAGRGMLARGCFWLPSRPGRVCTWEVAGGVVSVGDAGQWADGPRCHLVVTGVAEDEVCDRLTAAFAAILLRTDELAEALAWAGAPDGLEDWFGDDVA